MTLAIACSGGGNWCVAQLGFIHALQERGYQTRAASGVSFGSFAAYSAVTGDPLGAMAKLRVFRELVDMNLLRPWEHRFSPRQVIHRIERALRHILPSKVEAAGDYFVMAVKVPTMQAVAFDKAHELPAMLRAAMAMPPLPAFRYHGHVLRDAGVRGLKYGLAPLVKAGYQKLLCLGSFPDLFDVRWKAMKRMIPMFRGVKAHEVVMPMASRIGVAEFTKAGLPVMEAVFEEGYRVGRSISSHILDDLVNDRPVAQDPPCSAVLGA
jgi:hypothetical protein